MPLHDQERSTATLRCILRICFLVIAIGSAVHLEAEPQIGSFAGVSAALAVKGEPTERTNATFIDPGKTATLDAGGTPAFDASGEPVGDETLLLEVKINGQPTGKIGEFLLRRGKLMARPDELRQLGLRLSDPLIAGSHDLISLSNIRGLVWNLDQKNLTLSIIASDDLLIPTIVQPYARKSVLEHREIESGTGMTLNYDLLGSFAADGPSGTGSLDARIFSPFGVASSGWLAFAGAQKNTSVRLDSTYAFADVNSLRRYSVGDYINGGLSWTRPVHMEGVQVNSDFSMRPDLITFPIPTINGSASVPSTVEVLTDGNVAASSEIGAGPFQIPQLPVVSGAGTITMTVTNALGQQTIMTQPFYASSSLLAPGLQTFALQSGAVRRSWGSESYDYGKIAGSAFYRRGLTSTFTIEGAAEGTPGTLLFGIGGVQQIGTLGVINASLASSSGWGHNGVQYSVGAQRIGRVFSLGGSVTAASRSFRDIATINGDGTLRKQMSGFSSLYLRRFGSLGAAYGGIDQDASPVKVSSRATDGRHSHIVSASYSSQIRRVMLYASLFKDVNGARGGSGLQVGINIPVGRKGSVGASWSSDGNAQLQAQRSAPLIGDWGYNTYVSMGNANHAFGQVQYKSPGGLFTAGVDESGGETTGRIEADGALSFADSRFFLSNRIYDSFAIVDTGPVKHVEVLQENRTVGRTNSAGRLLVPDLRSFDLNHIAIVPTDVPADVRIETPIKEMRPQDRSGIIVRFPVKVSRAALLHLVDEDGKDLPVGSVAALKSTGAVVPVGYDGSAYLEDLNSHNDLEIERTDGRRCSVSFEFKEVAGDIPAIGPLRCKETRP